MIIGVVVAAAILTFQAADPWSGQRPFPEREGEERVDGPVVVGDWRFTPSVWTQWILPMDDGDVPTMYMSPWFGFDHSLLLENNNGSRFNFGGFDSVGLKNGPGVVTSSNGHTLHYVTLRHMARHYEVQWQNVEWVRFDNHDFLNSDRAAGFDNLVVSVDEPSTAFLLLVGLAGLGVFSLSYKRYFARTY